MFSKKSSYSLNFVLSEFDFFRIKKFETFFCMFFHILLVFQKNKIKFKNSKQRAHIWIIFMESIGSPTTSDFGLGPVRIMG